jgi:chlorite dismutase
MSQLDKYELHLPKGSDVLQRIYAVNITDTHKERSATDVIFVAYQKPNKNFVREGKNIYSNITVSLADKFRPSDYEFKNADGNIVKVRLNDVKDGDIVSYNVNKTSVKFNTNMNVYWYKHSLSYVNNNDINVNSFLYAKLENNKFVEIPMVIKAKVYPYELKTKQGIMNYNLK